MRCLAVFVAMLATACYDPELRDCTVTCHGKHDCAEGQVCGSDGYCAAPDVANKCDELREDLVDAGPVACDPAAPTAAGC